MSRVRQGYQGQKTYDRSADIFGARFSTTTHTTRKQTVTPECYRLQHTPQQKGKGKHDE